jgi:hypothetical protein
MRRPLGFGWQPRLLFRRRNAFISRARLLCAHSPMPFHKGQNGEFAKGVVAV